MRRLTTLVALILMLFGGLLIATAPTAAAPPVHIQSDQCNDINDVITYCEQLRGVAKENTSASGNTIYVLNGKFCFQNYVNGELVYDECQRIHQNLVGTEDGVFVGHNRVTAEWIYVDPDTGITHTCTAYNQFVLANGEVRRSDSGVECTPPL